MTTSFAPSKTHHTRRKEFLSGAAATFPLVVGALASTVGLSESGTQAMSLFVFAGSAQFITAGLIAQGTGLFIIIVTTFVVNLRHMLYAATLAPHTKDLPPRWLIPLGFWLTDESFVVVINRYLKADKSPNKHWFFLGSAVFMYTSWQLCTFIGILAGQHVDDPLKWGLDFAMIVAFIGMLVPMVRDKSKVIAVLTSGIATLILRELPNKLGLIIAALIGVAAGMIANNLIQKQNGGNIDTTN